MLSGNFKAKRACFSTFTEWPSPVAHMAIWLQTHPNPRPSVGCVSSPKSWALRPVSIRSSFSLSYKHHSLQPTPVLTRTDGWCAPKKKEMWTERRSPLKTQGCRR